MFRENSVAILSPGQDSQQEGMGEFVFHASDDAKRVFYIAGDVTGLDFQEICFGSQTERLNETLVAQPAITAVNIAEAEYLKKLGQRFDVGMGHSVGEIPLLAIAGILTVRDTFELVKVRAEATAKASKERPGLMGAVTGLTAEQVQSRASHILKNARAAITNFNGTYQQVFSGDREPMEELEKLIRELRVAEKIRVGFTKLRTGGAFHSAYHMENAVEEFYDAAVKVEYLPPSFDIMLNHAKYLSEVGTANLPDYLSQQLVKPVNFVGGAERLVDDGVLNYVEVGLKKPTAKYKTLSGLLKYEFAELVHIIEVNEVAGGSKRSKTDDET